MKEKDSYNSLPPWQKEKMDKYFPIVKKYIDEFDPIGVLPDAPEDHYDAESRAIACHMTGDCYPSDFLDVAQEIYIVIAYWFGKGQVREADCLAPAAQIVKDISLNESE